MNVSSIPTVTRTKESVILEISRFRITITQVKLEDKEEKFHKITISQLVEIKNLADVTNTDADCDNISLASHLQELAIDQKFISVKAPFETFKAGAVEFIKSNLTFEYLELQYINVLLEYYRTLLKNNLI